MSRKDNPPERSWLKITGKIIAILANIAVICGLIFAYLQIRQLNKLEKVRIAIETLNQNRTENFLKAFTRLKTIRVLKNISNYYGDEHRLAALTDDLNYVMSIFDHIAFLYINDLADKSLLQNAVLSDMEEFALILDHISSTNIINKPIIRFPKNYKKNFDRALKLLRQQSID